MKKINTNAMPYLYALILLIIGLCLPPLASTAQTQNYLPTEVGTNQIIHRTWYSLSYNEKYEQADWVAYELTAAEVNGLTPRKDSFKKDYVIKTGSAEDADYYKSGYDRGHLIPAADMKMSESSMSSSFYYSNISPQHPSLNRGIWSSLEKKVRQWAEVEGRVYVATGPVLLKGMVKTIGPNKVGVPKYFYKVIFDPTGEQKAIGFILENSNKNILPLSSYAVSVDSVESFTGLDFFYNISDDIENPVEAVFDISLWRMGNNARSVSTSATTSSSNSNSTSTTNTNRTTNTSAGQCEYYNGRKIITGSKGGKYYINSNGNKTYVSGAKRKEIVKSACR